MQFADGPCLDAGILQVRAILRGNNIIGDWDGCLADMDRCIELDKHTCQAYIEPYFWIGCALRNSDCFWTVEGGNDGTATFCAVGSTRGTESVPSLVRVGCDDMRR